MRLDVKNGPWDHRLAGEVTCTLDGKTIPHVIGADTVDGWVRSLQVDAKGNPVRTGPNEFMEQLSWGKVRIKFTDDLSERRARKIQLRASIARGLRSYAS